jgi:hypothetical protein
VQPVVQLHGLQPDYYCTKHGVICNQLLVQATATPVNQSTVNSGLQLCWCKDGNIGQPVNQSKDNTGPQPVAGAETSTPVLHQPAHNKTHVAQHSRMCSPATTQAADTHTAALLVHSLRIARVVSGDARIHTHTDAPDSPAIGSTHTCAPKPSMKPHPNK